MVLQGSPFGLSSVVLNFNRTPALQTAFSRRTAAVASSFFSDDIGMVDLSVARGSGQEAIKLGFRCAGLELDEAKEQSLAPERCYRGQSVDAGRTSALGVVKFDLKPHYRENVNTSIAEVLASGRCSSGTAAKIRGHAGWASITIHGKCGRVGQWALVQRQYFDDIEAITPALERSLHYIQLLCQVVGPSEIYIWNQRRPAVRIYSDA